MTAINPIADPVLSAGGVLTFRNAAVDADVAALPRGYRATWSTFDNVTGGGHRIGESSGRIAQFEAPEGLPSSPGTFIKVELSSTGAVHASWEKPVTAIFLRVDGSWRLVGFERMPEA